MKTWRKCNYALRTRGKLKKALTQWVSLPFNVVACALAMLFVTDKLD